MKGRLSSTLLMLVGVNLLAMIGVLALGYSAGAAAKGLPFGDALNQSSETGMRLLFGIVVIAIGVIITYVRLESKVAKPTKELAEFSERLASGDYRAKAEIETADDFGFIADNLNRMLGIGGVRALRALGIDSGVFHLNEGHSFLCAIERIRELRASRQMTLEEARLVARAGIVFTTHTPIAAGSDYFDSGLVWDLLGPYLSQVGISFDRFMDLGRQRPGDPRERFCTTYAALRLADQSVGVSRLHGAVSRRLWKDAWRGLPENQVPIGSVTNGVHMPTWVAPEIAALLNRYVGPDWWDLDPSDGRWHAVDEIPPADLWAIHGELKRKLFEFSDQRAETPRELDLNALTIGFGRRFAPYKRANLLLRDRPRLTKLLRNSKRPVQILFAGKSHPADQPGKDIVAGIVALAREEPRVVFLKDYDIALARHLVQGADVWLNNPRRFLEASGTSGMKAGANGALNVSILDGWWDEAYRPELGWAIPSGATLDRQDIDDVAEAEGLYRLLEREVVPAFYDRDESGIPPRWIEMMKASIRNVATQFSARRMVIDYFNAAYAPGARRVEQLRLLPDWGG